MKKGFTLIELLAVIVILAVISLIAIPIVMNIIEDSRQAAAKRSAEGYVRAVNYKIAQEALYNRIVDESLDYVIGENALEVEGKNIRNITGSYVVADSRVLWAGLCINRYSVEYNFGNTQIKGNYCGIEEPFVFVEPDAELMSAACKNENIYNTKDKFKIKTVEDLACLSNLSNSGKDFTDKTIYLLSDIDITNNDSYSDPTTTIYGDINGDNVVEGLKTELTTGAGFNPIGQSTHFKGLFDGYAFTISNLMINNNGTNVGLFGYNEGTIKGLKIRNATITSTISKSGSTIYVGTVAGYSKGYISNVDVTSTITDNSSVSTRYIGGVVGYSTVSAKELLYSGNISGRNYIGGLVGDAYGTEEKPSVTTGVVYDTNITIANASSVGKGVGYAYYNRATSTIRSKNVTITGSTSCNYCASGMNYENDDILVFDDVLDTVVGGDTNNDNYYFDYDEDGNLTLFTKLRTPIETNKLKGSGTEDSHYIIRNASDWRLASATIDKDTPKYYGVYANIDFEDKNFYPMGTNNNKFNGYINGNMYTISNISTTGTSSTGVFGYSTGTIEGFNFDSIDITGYGNATGIIGQSTGTIKGIKARNIEVTGSSQTSATTSEYIGGLVGKATGPISSIDVQATIDNNSSVSSRYIGGIVGETTAASKSLLFSGSITGKTYVGGLVGRTNGTQQAPTNVTGLVYDTTITTTGSTNAGKAVGYAYYNESSTNTRSTNTTITGTNSCSYCSNGRVYTLGSMLIYDDVLDTYIGGDNDSDGYYFDYDSNGDLTVFSIASNRNPITLTLEGTGTDIDPYKISSVEDWNMATSTISSEPKYYVLTADLDFTGKNYYPMGTNSNKFNGVLSGEYNNVVHTMSNVTIEGVSYSGLFGFNTGTIKSLKLNNISITGSGDATGIVGKSTGTIKGIKGRNITINAYPTYKDGSWNYAGGLVGFSSGLVSSIDIRANVLSSTTGTDINTGGIIGQSEANVDNLLFGGRVTSKRTAGGLIGSSRNNMYGVVKGVDLTATDTSSPCIGYAAGSFNTSGSSYTLYSTSSALHYSGTRYSYARDGRKYSDANILVYDDVLDTYIGGDNDSDGYYFDYDSTGDIALFYISENPITNTLAGSGTEADPYKIASTDDWKVATGTISSTPKYYVLTADLNFTNKNFYPMGTEKNKFNGSISGEYNNVVHTISNVSITGSSYTGLFGYNTGTIKNLKFNNISVSGIGETSGIIGQSTGTIKGIKARNITVQENPTYTNVSWYYAGGLVGLSSGLVSNVDMNATVTSATGGNDVNTGGIIGKSEANIDNLLFSGTVSSKRTAGGLVGNNRKDMYGVINNASITTSDSSSPCIGYAAGSSDTSITFATRYSDSSSLHYSGTRYSYARDGRKFKDPDILVYDDVLDTYVGGDNNLDGYYFDYDSNGNIILFYTSENPIANTLNGTGTESNPYRIANANDWKMASATISLSGKYYKVTSDIDFTGKKYYPLGTNTNKFMGYINGDMHTVSNVYVNGHDYTGLFGYNSGTIEGFKFRNINIYSSNLYAGLIGYNTGTIKGIEGRNITATAVTTNDSNYSYIGGLVGKTTGNISSIDLKGEVTANNFYAGGILGDNRTIAKSLIFEGTVSGKDYVGGVAGYSSVTNGSTMIISGVVNNTTVTATTTNKPNLGKAIGYKYTGTSTMKNRNTTVNRESRQNYVDGTTITDLTLEAIGDSLDTTDSDSDGYYFGVCNGTITLLSTRLTPVGTNACVATPVDDTPTHGGIVYLNPKNLSQTCTKTDAENNKNSNGKYTGVKDGCMKFYIFESDGSNYKMILDHNTSGDVSWAIQSDFIEAGGDLTEWQTNEGSTSRGPVTANKQLALDTTGWSGNPRLPSANEIAHITGADTSLLWATGKTYANPVTDKTTQIGLFYFDGSGNSYTGWTSKIASATNKSKYYWLFDNTYSCIQNGCNIEDNNAYTTSNNGTREIMGYWTSDAYNISYPWAVTSSGQLGSNNVTDSSNMGVRPVITLPKSSVTVN